MRQCGKQYATEAAAQDAAALRAERSSKPGTWRHERCRGCGEYHVSYRKPAATEKSAKVSALPKQRTRIRQVSARRARENRERRAMVIALFPERPLCVVYVLSQDHPGVIPSEVISRCGRWADDVHEPLTRARGGAITDPGNAVPPCRPCHNELGREPGWGYELGLLVHSWGPGRHAGLELASESGGGDAA